LALHELFSDPVPGFLQIGLVIDLTNTNRYYKEKEFTSQNVKYIKVRTNKSCVSARVVPSGSLQLPPLSPSCDLYTSVLPSGREGGFGKQEVQFLTLELV
jgi:hypothetical protein